MADDTITSNWSYYPPGTGTVLFHDYDDMSITDSGSGIDPDGLLFCKAGEYVIWDGDRLVCEAKPSGISHWIEEEPPMDLAPTVIVLAVIGLATCIGSVFAAINAFYDLFDRTKALRKRIKRLERKVGRNQEENEE